MKNKLQTVDVPPVSNEFAAYLQKVFPALKVTFNTSSDEIKYNAGIQLVIEFIKNRASGTTISSDITNINIDNIQDKSNIDSTELHSKSLLNRLLGLVR